MIRVTEAVEVELDREHVARELALEFRHALRRVVGPPVSTVPGIAVRYSSAASAAVRLHQTLGAMRFTVMAPPSSCLQHPLPADTGKRSASAEGGRSPARVGSGVQLDPASR